MRFEGRAAPVRHQVLAGLAARLGDAVGIGEGERARPANPAVRPDGAVPRAGPAAAPRPAPGQAAHVLGALRAVAAEALDPLAEVDVHRRRGRARRGPRRDRRRRAARPTPRRDSTMRARRGGSGRARRRRPSSVMRPSASSAPRSRSRARASLSAGRGRRVEEGEARSDRSTPQAAQSSRSGREIGGQDLGAREGLRAPRSRPPPTGGSRRPARCARRGPRRWSAAARETRTVSSRVRPMSGS